jgi:AAA+ ATPase superfamily predicted ATPase
MNNPFFYGKAVKGSFFFDRKTETERIIQVLTGGNNMVLYAPRRFGKTSLVFHVIEKLEKQGYICIYFDFTSIYTPEAFVTSYARTLAKKQGSLEKFASSVLSFVKNVRPFLSLSSEGSPELSLDFARTGADATIISDVVDLTEKIATDKKRIIVFFDEFQAVERMKDINFEGILRSRIQFQEKTSYLFLGSKTHVMQEMFNSQKRPFYESAFQMTIRHIPETDTIAWLREKFLDADITLDTVTAQYLIACAGNIPHYIQLLASEVWQYLTGMNKSVDRDAVDLCVHQVLELKLDYYQELFDRQSQGKRQVLQALTRDGKNVFSIAYLRDNRLSSISTVQRAIKEMVLDGIVEKVEGEYTIADPFFSRFVKSTM